METSRTRINYRLLGKIRGIKHQERTQIFEGDENRKVGLNINWDLYGKVLEAKARREFGDSWIITSPEQPKKSKFSLSGIFKNYVNPLFSLD